MRILMTAAAFLALTTGTGLAQMNPATGARPGNDIGTGQSLPTSDSASNTMPTNARRYGLTARSHEPK